MIVQHPNALGILEPASDLFAAARQGGAKAIQVFDPLSLGVLAPPGELGADIAVAEGQSLGNHLAFGGPYLGLIAARASDVRRLPGRIVGETVDVDGEPGTCSPSRRGSSTSAGRRRTRTSARTRR